jgi:hypothetical protein
MVAQNKPSGKVIKWTRPMLARFKVAYQHAAGAGKTQFEFDGNLFVVGYAKYLIEFLETQFKEPF